MDQEFDFSRWRALPNQDEGKKAELGGAILQSDVKGDAITLVLRQLPIVRHPAYGPKDTGKRSGEFAATFSGTLEPKFLQRGNRVIVVGTTRLAKVVVVDDIPRSLPNLEVKCLHIWNTGGVKLPISPRSEQDTKRSKTRRGASPDRNVAETAARVGEGGN